VPISIVGCLFKLASIHGSRNEVVALDFNSITYQKVQYLPSNFDGNIVFELPPLVASFVPSASGNLHGMDKRFDGHAWCRTMTSNIHNNDGLKFRKSSYIGHLVCNNSDYDYFKWLSKCNDTEWCGYTLAPFCVGSTPLKNSTLLCKICKCSPQSVSFVTLKCIIFFLIPLSCPEHTFI